MIECYTNNATVGENEAVVFNNTALKKGCTVESNGATIQFNRCGIYEVNVNASAIAPSATSSAPVDVSLQLMKNGVAQPQAKATETAASETAKVSLGFTTLVQAPANNTCNMCTAPTTCSIVNSGAEATYDAINIVVTKLV